MKGATIISIGNELLNGDVIDTNSAWLAKKLSSQGVVVEKIVVVGDDKKEIGEAIKNSVSDFIFVLGGLGPTHDDVTREGVAKGVGKNLIRNEEAERTLKERYEINGDLLRMADMPEGSKFIENPVGVAPGFIINNVIVMPGMPEEMKGMFNEIAPLFVDAEGIKEEEWIMLDKLEHAILDVLNEVVKRFENVKIGSYPCIERKYGRKIHKLRIKLQSTDLKALKKAKKCLEGAMESPLDGE